MRATAHEFLDAAIDLGLLRMIEPLGEEGRALALDALGRPEDFGVSPLRASYPAWRFAQEVRRIRAMDEARYRDRRRDDEVWS